MAPTVRFAPSPTGLLHLGNARTAVVNWLFARQRQGRLILRLDDTDRERSRPEHEAAIREDLAWLGIAWDAEHRQSERAAVHEAAFERLRRAGRVYACHETPDQLEARRQALLARGEPPRYRRPPVPATAPDRPPHWRFQLADEPVAFTDLIRGRTEVRLDALSDPVVRREDGSATYLFASVVDDLDLGISHVIRGEDHLTNTGPQLAIAAALGGAAPAFAHLPLVQDIAGGKLSKRLGSTSLRALRAEEIEPLAVVATLATLGTGRSPGAPPDLEALTLELDLAAFAASQPRLDLEALRRTSAAVLHAMPAAEAAARLGLPGLDERFWLAVRPNLSRLSEAMEWWRICREPLAPVVEDVAFLHLAAELLTNLENEPEAVSAWLRRLGEATGRRGRALYHPLRLALTAREHGPELRHLLPLLGRDRAWRRLRGQTA